MIILALLALVLYLARIPGMSRLDHDQVALSDRARKRRLKQKKSTSDDLLSMPEREKILQREMTSVPTPWGWPGHHHDAAEGSDQEPGVELDGRGISHSMQRWVNHLVTQKRTVGDREYVLRKNASMRALLEDRFGRPSQMADVEYQQVKAPLLRDPSQPHDQMDNFPSGRTEKITEKLEKRPLKSISQRSSQRKLRKTELKQVKTPWGW